MAFDDKTRNRLQKLVSDCRGLLSAEFAIQVQQTYGLDPNSGELTPLDRLAHLAAEVTLIVGAGHLPHMERPQAVNAVLRQTVLGN